MLDRLILLMAKHVKNIELVYEKQPISIAHQRATKIDDPKIRLQELNFWKAFTRMPRTNSLTQQQPQEELLTREEEKLIVISSFKHTETTNESLSKNFRLHRQKLRRYISDDDFVKTGKNSQNTSKGTMQQLDDEEDDPPPERLLEVANLPSLQDEQIHSQMLISKRSALSSNYSQLKTKQRIVREIGKKIFLNLPERSSSKVKLPELKEEKRYPVLVKDPEELREVKSESFIIVEMPSQRVIISHRSVVSLEIASLTKIMTFHTVLSLATQYSVDIASTTVVISPKVTLITGTSADLVEGEEYTLQQLLYGLMLPSGNDAANELAYWGGALLGVSGDHKLMQKAFVGEMNRLARVLVLRNTKFANPHGLPHQEARSTAADLAKLCCHCMKNELFRKITSCRNFKATVRNGSCLRVVQWENTNKILRRQGFAGLKTGITVTAGPCLAAAYQFRDRTYISVILRAPKVSARFKETRLLIWWALGKLYKDLSEGERQQLKKLKRHDRDLDSDNSEDEQEFRYDNGGAGEYKRRCNILNYQL